jgi:hypothetical protein
MVPDCRMGREIEVKWKNDGFIFPYFSFATGGWRLGWLALFFDGCSARNWANRFRREAEASRSGFFCGEETGA